LIFVQLRIAPETPKPQNPQQTKTRIHFDLIIISKCQTYDILHRNFRV